MLLSSLKTTLFGLMVLLLSAAPAVAQIIGNPQQDDHFGEAVATGDFNNDGYADLAVGVPGDDVGANQAGAVNVIYGTADGLDVPDNALWHQDSPGVLGVAEDFDWFGYSVAVGDFNGDNFDDLAIGVPFEDVGAIGNAGAVNVLYGSASGLQTASNQILVHDDFSDAGNSEADDRFGWSLAAGDFDNDGHDDLAIGIAYEDVGAVVDAGAVQIAYGTPAGLDPATDDQFWQQTFTGTGTFDAFDSFGFSLAVGNFDNDNYDDLAIGIIGEDVVGQNNAGGVAVMYGTNTGLSAAGSQLWSQEGVIGGTVEAGDQFGFSVTTGDFDNDDFDDLVAGVPFEDIGAISNAGAVNVIYGTGAGLSSTDNQLFTEDTAGIPLTVEENDNFGYSLAAGRLGQDSDDELVIGVAGEGVGGAAGAGAILVIAGAPGGLDPSKAALIFTQDDAEVEGDAETGDRFGHALAVGDFDNNGRDDIAVGVRNEEIDGNSEAGAVNVLYDVLNGLSSSDLWFQGAMPVAIEPEAPELPTTFALLPAYPNPFNPSTTLRYDVPEAGPVRITVFDALGREIGLLVNEEHTAGRHEIAFDAQGLPSGTYIVRMEAGNTSQAQRVALLR